MVWLGRRCLGSWLITASLMLTGLIFVPNAPPASASRSMATIWCSEAPVPPPPIVLDLLSRHKTNVIS